MLNRLAKHRGKIGDTRPLEGTLQWKKLPNMSWKARPVHEKGDGLPIHMPEMLVTGKENGVLWRNIQIKF